MTEETIKGAQVLSPGPDPLLILPTAPLQQTQQISLSTHTSGSVSSFITGIANPITISEAVCTHTHTFSISLG